VLVNKLTFLHHHFAWRALLAPHSALINVIQLPTMGFTYFVGTFILFFFFSEDAAKNPPDV